MKKLLLPITVLFSFSLVFAQAPRVHNTKIGHLDAVKSFKKHRDKKNYADLPGPSAAELELGLSHTPRQFKADRSSPQAVTSEVIGTTVYDLQTNNAVARRLLNLGAGKFVGTWTFGTTATSYPERGSGYVYNDGSAWSAAPTARIEQDRTGWPNPVITANGTENVFSHFSGGTNDGISQSMRTTVGSGTWNSIPVSNTSDATATWIRAASSGDNIHIINSHFQASFNNLAGGIAYFRSTDGGVSFEGPTAIQDLDSLHFGSVGGDAYAIDAKDNTVAFIVGGFQPTLFKSTDNGSTWTMKIIRPISNPLYKGDSGQLLDSVVTTDESYSLLIDNNDVVHVWYGKNTISDADTAAGWSYFPFDSGIMYWNETMTGFPVEIPTIYWRDEDGDGQTTLFSGATANSAVTGLYFANMISFPCAGVDADNNIFVTFSMALENSSSTGDNTGVHYRNLYAVGSTDGGATWSDPINLTKDEFGAGDEYKFTEAVYGSLARTVDDNLHVLFMKDDVPGTTLQQPTGYTHPAISNQIRYMAVPKCRFSARAGTDKNICPGGNVMLNGSGGVSYMWSPGVDLDDSTSATPTFYAPDTSQLPVGYFRTYTVTTTDGTGCTSQASVRVIMEDNSKVANAGEDFAIIKGTSGQLNGSGGDTYVWSPATGLSNPNVANPVVTIDATMSYELTVTSGTCTDIDSVTVTVNLPTSADQVAFTKNMISQNKPNPFDENTIITLNMPSKESVEVFISNIVGQKVLTLVNGNLGAGAHNFQVSKEDLGMKAGVYFYTLKTANSVVTKKMIVN